MAPPSTYAQEMQLTIPNPQISVLSSERHDDYDNLVRNFIIGFADGLTVPFALTAGLSSYVLIRFWSPPYLSDTSPCVVLDARTLSLSPD